MVEEIAGAVRFDQANVMQRAVRLVLERGLWRGSSHGCCTTSMLRCCDTAAGVTPSQPP